MRSVVVICVVSAWIALADGAPAQAPFAPVLAGTVTLIDTNNELIVIQDRSQARAVKLDVPVTTLEVGERVMIEGKVTPYCAAFPDYPDHPSGTEVVGKFQVPPDSDNHFLARLRGYLRVPINGNYTFWVAADDEAELLLGSASAVAAAKPIASVSNSTRIDEWERDPEQKSKPVYLKAGENYYIEAKQREWRGHDHLAVAWQGPGFERRVIDGAFLSPLHAEGGVTNGLLREYWTNCFITRLAMLSANVQDTATVRVSEAHVTSQGRGELPPPRRVRIDQAGVDDRDFIYVEVEGTANFVTSDKGQLTMELTDSKSRRPDAGARMMVRVLNWGNTSVAPLKNRKLRVRGVCEQAMNERGEPTGALLWVQDASQITPLGFGEFDSRELEVLPMFDLTPANLNLAWGRKVLVRGSVINHDSKSGMVTLRGDDSYYAYSSSDGATWDSVGVPVPVAMGDSIYVGLVASSITRAGGSEAAFDQVNAEFKPGSWVGLGNEAKPDSVALSNSSILLRPAVGNDWETKDEALFLYQKLEAEGELVARLHSFKTTRISDKAGLMMRESLAPDAPFVALVMTHDTRLDLLYRQSPPSMAKAVVRGASEVPRWLKLVRRRHTLKAQLLSGQRIDVRRQVELVGLLNWRNGEPVLVNACVQSTDKSAQRPLMTAETREVQIADLPSSAAESDQYIGQNYLVRGVVTFMGRAFGRELLFLQDESGAAAIRASPVFFRGNSIEPGQLLEAKGDVQFAPGVPPFRMNTSATLGWGTLPRPQPYPDRSDAKHADSRWVEMKGIVRAVTNNVMRVMSRNGLVTVWVGGLESSNTLDRYLDDLVTVRGVFSMQVSPEPVLLAPAPRFIEVVESAPDDPFVIPSFAISKVWVPDINESMLHRTKVSGVVTYRDENTLVVQDQTGGARVLGDVKVNVRVGDRVEVVGFPDMEDEAVTLRESILRKVGEGQMPEPIEMMIEGLLDSRLNCWLVRLEGIVLDQKIRSGRQLLELQNGPRVFEVVMSQSAGQLKPLSTGSRVQVTGVTQLQIASHSPGIASRRDNPLVATMDILMRTPADLVLLEQPPWWTWRHTVALGALFLVMLAGALGWIRALRRRVAQRTSELQAAMSRLQEETELSATLAERERLAAEIHDTLEQGLSGIMMQLDGVDSRLASDTAGARQNLEMARRMVRFSRAEVRHSLWNLESQLLKDGDLGAAIKEIARQMSAGCSTVVAVDVSDNRCALPAAIEHHLLRCNQEAISNALKHSGAKQIRVKLNYAANEVELVVSDDGCGFDSSQVLTGPGMHLGLRNLRSRARKMKGQLTIVSEPLKGTTVRLTVPLNGRVERGPGPTTSKL